MSTQQQKSTVTCHDRLNSNNDKNAKATSPKLNVFNKIIISNEPFIDLEKTLFCDSSSDSNKTNILVEYSDNFLKTKNFKILLVTLTIFLCSLWILANFDANAIKFHRKLQHYRNSRVAIVAASVMGDSGEEGIHGLEIEAHDRLSYIRTFYIVNEEEDEDEDEEEDYGDESEGSKKDSSDYRYRHHHRHDNNRDHEIKDEYDIISDDDSLNIKDNEIVTNRNNSDNDTSSQQIQDNLEIEIEKLISEKPIVIFSKSYCPYSRRVKHILSYYNVSPHISVIEVDKRDDSENIKQTLVRLTYRSTFPNIFIDGISVGGSDELAIMHINGKLLEILAALGLVSEGDEGDDGIDHDRIYKKGDFIVYQHRHHPYNYHSQEHSSL